MMTTSIRHIRFSDTLLIEQILSNIESMMRGIEQMDSHVASTQLQVAVNHIEGLQGFFPSREHREIVDGIENIIAHLQHRHSRRSPRLQGAVIHRG